MAALLLATSRLPRSVLPLIVITFPPGDWWKAKISLRRHPSNSAGEMLAKTLLNRSYDGMPFQSSRDYSNHFRFWQPKSAIATKSSAPQITAQIPITRKLIGERLILHRRGSIRLAQCTDISASIGMSDRHDLSSMRLSSSHACRTAFSTTQVAIAQQCQIAQFGATLGIGVTTGLLASHR